MTMEELRGRFGERILAFQAAAHRCPERGGEEYQTTALIRAYMGALGLEELAIGPETGAAFLLRSGRPGKATVLRADIDGLSVQEPETHQVRSGRTGMMHACGHDVHMASLYGAALALSERPGALAGDVVFLFQPAEETMGGATGVIDGGLFSRVPADALFGLHNMPSLPVGTVGVREGPLMAAKDGFSITVYGRGGHGAMPEQCADPIVAAAAVVTALQTIVSRGVAPLDTAVVSVCSIHGGSTDNRIEDAVVMTGSARAFLPKTRAFVLRRIEEIVRACAAAHGCTAAVSFPDQTPPVVNAPSLLPAAQTAAARIGRLVRPEMVMISEDFAFYGEQVPAFFFFLGSAPERMACAHGAGARACDGAQTAEDGAQAAPLHSADFCAHPDTALYGAALLSELACRPAEAGADR